MNTLAAKLNETCGCRDLSTGGMLAAFFTSCPHVATCALSFLAYFQGLLLCVQPMSIYLVFWHSMVSVLLTKTGTIPCALNLYVVLSAAERKHRLWFASERTVDYEASECPAMCNVDDFSRELSSSMLTYDSVHTFMEASKESAMQASYIASVNVKSRVIKEDMEQLFAAIQKAKKSILSAERDWTVSVRSAR